MTVIQIVVIATPLQIILVNVNVITNGQDDESSRDLLMQVKGMYLLAKPKNKDYVSCLSSLAEAVLFRPRRRSCRSV